LLYRLIFAFILVGAATRSPGQLPPASVQVRREIIRGRVTTDSGAVLAGAAVFVTRAPDRLTMSTKTEADGRYEIVFEQGTGDYLVHVSAVGRRTLRKRVTRQGGDSVFVVDAQLASAVQQLNEVRIEGRIKPDRDQGVGAEVGGAERFSEGVNAAVPPALAGDLAAIAGQTPGAFATQGGFSVLGLDPAQNNVILNGMVFTGAAIPREARTQARVSTSTYDPARGWFSGAQTALELVPGGLFSFRQSHFTLDAPILQYTDPIASRLGQRFTQGRASIGGNGKLGESKYYYNYGAQVGRMASDAVSLLDADKGVLQRAGVSADSVAHLLALLANAGVPAGSSPGGTSRATDEGSFVARIDHEPYDWKTYTPARVTWGLTAHGALRRTDALGVSPTTTPTQGGTTTSGIAGLQGLYSFYFRDLYLTDVQSAVTLSVDRARPYLRLPAGRVFVASDFPDAADGWSVLQFGGNGALTDAAQQWTWEAKTQTGFYVGGKPTHAVKLTADSRLDGYSQTRAADRLGTFSFNSLADLEANRPAAFTRTLNAPQRKGAAWNGFLALGDVWRKSQRLQLGYGARVEGNAFLSSPGYNPRVDSLFGVRTSYSPHSLHVSPRLAFTWFSGGGRGGRSSPIGQFIPIPVGFLRGGVGEFRNMLPPTLLSEASVATGLPGGVQRLNCVGPAAPAADWVAFLSDPASVPNRCLSAAGAVPAFTDSAPSVELFDRTYRPPRSWRSNVAWSSALGGLTYTLEGIYSLNLDQPGWVDLNFADSAHFTLADEGRKVFVSPSSIVPSTGVVSPVEARRSSAFGRVASHRSDVRSESRQVTLTVAPDLTGLVGFRWFASLSYTLAQMRELANGYERSTFGGLNERVWGRGDFDARHQILLQGGWTRAGVALTMFGRVTSGLPFTPMVGSDVNGDGLANDRAFVFDPATVGDSTIANGMRALYAVAPRTVRRCLTGQLEHAALRNSCEGPWTASLNAQINATGELLHLGRRWNVSLNLANPLGGLDYLLHGSNGLKGWGNTPTPDPVLFNVRGFDSSARRFQYEVNPRFGNTRPTNTLQNAPFRVTLDVRVDVGTLLPQQQLERWLRPGRASPGPRLTVEELKQRYSRNVPDPYAGILQESDSLLLTRDQVEQLQKAQTLLRQRMDSLWTGLAEYLGSLGDHYDPAQALKRQEDATDDAWEISRVEVQKALTATLFQVQLKLLPWPAQMLYNAREKLKGIRMFGAADERFKTST
jgi:hypothetical protein